jgi:hypothetical protein
VRPSPVLALLAALLAVLLLPAVARAADEFERVEKLWRQEIFYPPDARSLALGWAATSLADGPAAAGWNPGALCLPGPIQALAPSVSELVPRSSRLRQLQVGLAGSQGGYGAGLLMVEDRFSGKGLPVFSPGGQVSSMKSSDTMFLLAAGVDVGEKLLGFSPAAHGGVGLGIKSVRSTVGREASSIWDLDFGSIWSYRLLSGGLAPLPGKFDTPPLEFRLGYAARNILNRKAFFFHTPTRLGRRDRFSAGVIAAGGTLHSLWPLWRWSGVIEREGIFFHAVRTERAIDHAGIELTLASVLSLRTGMVWNRALAFRDRTNTWGLGLGLEPGNPLSPGMGGRFDYGNTETLFGTHREQYSLSLWAAI